MRASRQKGRPQGLAYGWVGHEAVELGLQRGLGQDGQLSQAARLVPTLPFGA
ncbi:hypothetical protein ACS5PN_24960 [Roseateles sp. NT4]|uniref:hypothetical protein n=1 Tax=Roseateles sp. NT4 TaxID=3453715 RepID=UPI003EE86054